MQHLCLYGAGGHAKVIAEIAEELGVHIRGVFDNSLLIEKILNMYPVYHNLEHISAWNSLVFIVAVGNNTHRKRIVEQELLGTRDFATLVHPAAVISRRADIDRGSVVMAGATVNVGAEIGQHCIINTNASIDHDCVIGNYVHISPNAALAGNVWVGEGTHVGIGATVIQGIKIGKWCTLGAGAVIIRDVPDGSTVVGNPGKIIKKGI